MSGSKTSGSGAGGKRKAKDAQPAPKSAKRPALGGDDFEQDLDISSDIKGILSALQQIKEKAHRDGQKKTEETLGSVASELRATLDDAKSKFEKERQAFTKVLSKTTKECENSLKIECNKFQEIYDRFCKEKTAHLEVLKDVFTKFEDEKDKLHAKHEQLRKKEKSTLAELEKTISAKIASAEESLKKKKQDGKSFSILRKQLGSFLGSDSEEESA